MGGRQVTDFEYGSVRRGTVIDRLTFQLLPYKLFYPGEEMSYHHGFLQISVKLRELFVRVHFITCELPLSFFFFCKRLCEFVY